MPNSLDQFEIIVRSSARVPVNEPVAQPHEDADLPHAFDSRNIHPGLPAKVRKLFDDGHFAEATFHAFKFLDKQVQKYSRLSETGFKLMMAALDRKSTRLNSS